MIDKPKTNQVCKLCKKEMQLQSSHIISKFLYKELNLGNRQFYFYDNRINLLQRGTRQFRKHLLCKDCELLFSKNETFISKIIRDLNELDKNAKKSLFDTNDDTLQAIKFFCFGTLLREIYALENVNWPILIKRLEEYFLNDLSINVKMVIYIHTGEKDFTLNTTPIPLCYDDQQFIIYHFFNNIFVYMDLNDTHKKDETYTIPVDFTNPDILDKALIQGIDYVRKTLRNSNKSNNLNW